MRKCLVWIFFPLTWGNFNLLPPPFLRISAWKGNNFPQELICSHCLSATWSYNPLFVTVIISSETNCDVTGRGLWLQGWNRQWEEVTSKKGKEALVMQIIHLHKKQKRSAGRKVTKQILSQNEKCWTGNTEQVGLYLYLGPNSHWLPTHRERFIEVVYFFKGWYTKLSLQTFIFKIKVLS